MGQTTGFLLVTTTTAERADAQRIGRALVRLGVAACVQVGGPIESTYVWKGELEMSEEWLCTAKTTVDRYPRVESEIRRLHPYDEPEIIAVPIAAGSAGYLKWMAECLTED